MNRIRALVTGRMFLAIQRGVGQGLVIGAAFPPHRLGLDLGLIGAGLALVALSLLVEGW